MTSRARILLITLLGLCLPTLVLAQSTQQIRRGTPTYFDHDEQSIIATERYQLCEDTVSDATCHDLTNVMRIQGTLTFQFPLPTWVKNGLHLYVVRAFGEGEYSDPSSPSLTLHVTGKPLPPTNHRMTGPSTTQGTTTAPPPVPASVGTVPPVPPKR